MPSKAFQLLVATAICLMAIGCISGMDKKKGEANLKVGITHFHSGDIQRAYLKFQEALKYDPDNKEIHNALGNVYLRLNERDNAVKSFTQAVELDSTYSEAWNNLCAVKYMMRRYNDAISDCKHSLANPMYATPEMAYSNMGYSYFRMGRLGEAKDAFDGATIRQPVYFVAYYALALIYNAEGKFAKAAENMETALKFDPRFRGDRIKAEKEFQVQRQSADYPRDYSDFIEILHY